MYKVLIADDEPIILNGIKNMIDWNENIVLTGTARNGLEAIVQIEQTAPDIIISDIRMPGMDGLELIAKVKAELNETEFIILSGYCEFDYAVKAMQYGIKHFLSKPCNKQVLNDTLRKVIGELVQKHTEAQNMDTAITHVKNNILLELITNKMYGEKEWQQDTKIVDIQLRYCDPVRLILLKPVGIRDYEYVFAASNIAQELCVKDYVLHTMIEDKALLLVRGDRPLSTVRSILEKAREMFIRYYRCDMIIEVSDVGSPATARSLYRDIWSRMRTSPASGGDPIRIHSIKSETVKQMLQYIHQHFDQDHLTLNNMASKVLFRNADHLGKLFKKEVGTHFSHYVNEIRIRKASELLLASDLNIGEISERAGFGLNTRYFSQVFKKMTGYSPREYRKRKTSKATPES